MTSAAGVESRDPLPDGLRAEQRRRAASFWRFWAASTISRAGDAVTLVALPLVAVIALHATPLEVSLITAASFGAWLVVGLPAGVVVHRWPLRETQALMDLLRAAALLSLPAAAWLGILGLPQVIVVAVVLGLAQVVFDVGNSTLLPAIVEPEQLTARNSLMSGSDAVVTLAGPAVGGVLVAVTGAPDSLLVDAGSFVASAALLVSLPRPVQPPAPPGDLSIRRQVAVGLRYVARHDVVRPCVAQAAIVNFVCGGLLAVTPVFLVRTLGASPALVGVLVATEGAGSVLGATATPTLTRRLGSARAFRRASAVSALGALMLPLATAGTGLVTFAVGNAVFASGVVVVSILARTHRHAEVPPDLLPRVMATVRFVSWGTIPLGALIAGLAAQAVGPRTALLLLAGCALTGPFALSRSSLRGRRQLET